MVYKNIFDANFKDGEFARHLVESGLNGGDRAAVITSINGGVTKDYFYTYAIFCDVDIKNNEILTNNAFKLEFRSKNSLKDAIFDICQFLAIAQGDAVKEEQKENNLYEYEGKTYIISQNNEKFTEIERYVELLLQEAEK